MRASSLFTSNLIAELLIVGLQVNAAIYTHPLPENQITYQSVRTL